MVAVVSAVVGVVSVVALQSSLVQRLDTQVQQAASRFDVPPGGNDGAPPSNSESSLTSYLCRGRGGAGDTGGTVVALITDSVAVSCYTTSDGSVQSLDAAQLATLATVDSGVGARLSDPTTVDLGSLGRYRAIAISIGGATQVTAISLSDVTQTVTTLIWTILVVSLLGMLAAAFAATWFIRVALRPLDRVESTATRVAELQLERGEVDLAERVPEADADTRTEVGRVGAAFNRMLDHVGGALEARQASENKVRQFVADASHELRTPLAAIRGYAELPRRGGAELSDDAVYSLDRIESAATRMTSLVEDLLLLARLDEGRDLERESVDLTMVLIEAVSDAHVAGSDHEWDLELPDEPVEIIGDGFRLHQVVANLLRNANVHTPPGTRVVAALDNAINASGAPVAVVTVTDDGPGIDPALLPVLFERFARGDSSRARTTGSTGLGLAIVAAVVEAHRGTVTVDSVPGRTAFRVELPAS
ncbi:HAMP domain-containing histidine kinase [Microbacteriaceae bacterium VKM Ac-2855]|nr:HAMP domain-containing histidine kinase [Microbacteriaceae bacterium VKM Ac-2855]